MQKDSLKAQYLDETYENLAPLKGSAEEKVNIFVARHRQTGKIYVKKYVNKSLIPIYKKLLQINDCRMEKIFDYGADAQKGIIITEYISGLTLQDYLEENGPLSEQEACSIIENLLQVLQKVHHTGIIHRDINPHNVMLSNDRTVKLIDFNIARQKKESQSQDTAILGTAGYAAPEQYGFLQTDERTDIYAVGVLWNTLLTGCLPSQQKYSRHPLGEIIRRCTEMDIRQRYQNVQEILDALDKCTPPPLRQYVDTDNTAGEIHSWIPGFRTGSVLKSIVASFGYCLMLLVSAYSIWECKSPWKALILEILAVFLYTWVAPLSAANIGYFDRKIPFLRNIPTPARLIFRFFLCVSFFVIGFSLEIYIRDTLLGISGT